jgi:hypothetical protein
MDGDVEYGSGRESREDPYLEHPIGTFVPLQP